MNAFVVTIIVIAVVVAYFIPTIIATQRKVPSSGSVVVVNFFLGWTVIGWIVALAMSFRSAPPRPETVLPWMQQGQGER